MELSVRLNQVFLAACTSLRARPKWCSKSCRDNRECEPLQSWTKRPVYSSVRGRFVVPTDLEAFSCLACYYNHLIDCQAHLHLIKSPINSNHSVWHLRCFTVRTLVFIPFLRLVTRQASSPLGCGLSDYLSPECSLLLSFCSCSVCSLTTV